MTAAEAFPGRRSPGGVSGRPTLTEDVTMAIDYTRLSALKPVPPAEKKNISLWLNQTLKAPTDATKQKLYYQGVMGPKPLYVLSEMEPMPYGVAKPDGGLYSTAYDYRILVVFDNQAYDIRFELVECLLGSKHAIHDSRLVAVHKDYTVTGVFETAMDANDYQIMNHLLW
jgi:hypothetical protein